MMDGYTIKSNRERVLEEADLPAFVSSLYWESNYYRT